MRRMSATDPSDALALLLQELKSFPNDVRTLPVAPAIVGDLMRRHLEAKYSFDSKTSLETVLPDVMRMMRQWSLHTTHPRYFGLFNPPTQLAGIVGDALVALYNPQVGAWAHSPAAAEIERHVLAHFAR